MGFSGSGGVGYFLFLWWNKGGLTALATEQQLNRKGHDEKTLGMEGGLKKQTNSPYLDSCKIHEQATVAAASNSPRRLREGRRRKQRNINEIKIGYGEKTLGKWANK